MYIGIINILVAFVVVMYSKASALGKSLSVSSSLHKARYQSNLGPTVREVGDVRDVIRVGSLRILHARTNEVCFVGGNLRGCTSGDTWEGGWLCTHEPEASRYANGRPVELVGRASQQAISIVGRPRPLSSSRTRELRRGRVAATRRRATLAKTSLCLFISRCG